MNSGSRGVLIGIEGIDAAGKRTQTSILGSWLRSKGYTTRTISFPDYGTNLGTEIKKFLSGNRKYPPEVRHMLFAANRWEKRDELVSILSNTNVVVVNRYSESNLAYGVANGLKLEWLINLEAGLPKADAVIVLDAPPMVLSSRRERGKDEYERDTNLQERTRAAYIKLAGDFAWKVIDARGGIQATSQQVIAVVSDSLKDVGRTV